MGEEKLILQCSLQVTAFLNALASLHNQYKMHKMLTSKTHGNKVVFLIAFGLSERVSIRTTFLDLR